MIAATAADRATTQSLADEFASFSPNHPAFLTPVLLSASGPMIELGMTDTVGRLLESTDASSEWYRALLSGVAIGPKRSANPRPLVDPNLRQLEANRTTP